MRVGALKWRLPAWWSTTPNPQCTSLGARDEEEEEEDAGPMLVEGGQSGIQSWVQGLFGLIRGKV